MKLHEKILSNNNLSWHNCRNKVQYSDVDLGIITNFFNENKNEKMIGFKDPRTLIFYDSFKKNFKDVLPIGIFRDPLKCAKSIFSRDKFDLKYALEIWYFYNLLLFEYAKQDKIFLINFDENELKFFLLEKFLIDNSISDTQESFKFEEKSLINQTDVDFKINTDKYYNLYYDLIDLSIQAIINKIMLVIVASYEMTPYLTNTLFSLSKYYQSLEDYEVIVFTNGGAKLPGNFFRKFGRNFQYFHIDSSIAYKHPFYEINNLVKKSKYENLYINCDGARICSHNILKDYSKILEKNKFNVCTSPGYHLGPMLQRHSQELGYDRFFETKILKKSRWWMYPSAIFDISVTGVYTKKF